MGFSSKYFDVIEIVGILNSFEFRKSCLIASLQSSLYHELLLVGFVEV